VNPPQIKEQPYEKYWHKLLCPPDESLSGHAHEESGAPLAPPPAGTRSMTEVTRSSLTQVTSCLSCLERSRDDYPSPFQP
jgi:hypothetical protein